MPYYEWTVAYHGETVACHTGTVTRHRGTVSLPRLNIDDMAEHRWRVRYEAKPGCLEGVCFE